MRTSLISVGAAALLFGAPLAHAWCDSMSPDYDACVQQQQILEQEQEQTRILQQQQQAQQLEQMRNSYQPLPSFSSGLTQGLNLMNSLNEQNEERRQQQMLDEMQRRNEILEQQLELQREEQQAQEQPNQPPPLPSYNTSAYAPSATPGNQQPAGPNLMALFIAQAQGQSAECPSGSKEDVLPANGGLMSCVDGQTVLGFSPSAQRPLIYEMLGTTSRRLVLIQVHNDGSPWTLIAKCDIGFTKADATGVDWELRGPNAEKCGDILSALDGQPNQRTVSQGFSL